MSAIDQKAAALEQHGARLGPALAPEHDAGYGGRVRDYHKGSIYWHGVMGEGGAHVLAGAVLARYRSLGGPGVDASGARPLGFPLSDGQPVDGGRTFTQFEWGGLVARGTEVATINGPFWAPFKIGLGENDPDFGWPLGDREAHGTGTAMFFERACVWSPGPASPPRICRAFFPLIGQPTISIRADCVVAPLMWEVTTADEIAAGRELWRDRVRLRPVGRPSEPPVLVEPDPGVPVPGGFLMLLRAPVAALHDRTLYDIELRGAGGGYTKVAPHALYTRDSWSDWGFIHATDLHVSRRLEGWRALLRQLAEKDATLVGTAEAFNNFNDGVRDLIRYANHLHDLGLVDMILATGDLVDYRFEFDDPRGAVDAQTKIFGDGPQGGAGNMAFLRDLLLGAVPSQDAGHGQRSEELRVPIFTVLGNHDYRKNQYLLDFQVHIPIPFMSDRHIPYYTPLNLREHEARALQRVFLADRFPPPLERPDFPNVERETAVEMITIDPVNAWYHRHMNAASSYTIALGPHRVVMLDSGPDVGRIDDDAAAIRAGTDIGESSEEHDFEAASPDSVGITDEHLNLLTKAAHDAQRAGGRVVVGLHSPLLNLRDHEYAHYLRETEHLDAATDTRDFLNRKTSKLIPADVATQRGWVLDGSRYFKRGDRWLLDFGTTREKTDEFLRQLLDPAGPVDLVLTGHAHRNVEFRIDLDAQGALRYYMDFYSEDPREFYPCRMSGLDEAVFPRVVAGVTHAGRPVHVRSHLGRPIADYYEVEVPPYATPLASATEPRTWWDTHRPLIVQTGPTGPTLTQREQTGGPVVLPTGTVDLPLLDVHAAPSFQGFRVGLVRSYVIAKITHIQRAELLRSGFVLAWEREMVETVVG